MRFRCAWCAIQLRWWQFWREYCPVCSLELPSPPCPQGAKADKKWTGYW